MNKKYLKIFILSALFIAIGVFVLPHFAFAEEAKIDNNTLLGGISKSVVNTVLSSISYYILTVTSSLVTISGVLLSLSIKLTLSIGKIYDDIEGIRTIWRTIRDLSSIFIIFILLFESIKMILGLKGQGFNQTVVKIFIAGMLINFSLVFCKMTIDASNLVSIQFYNAITPGTSQTLDLSIKSIFNDGGLSNVFMQSLKIPRIYNSVKFSKDADVAMSILVATAGGIIMMITASFSFFAAAIAFTVRTGLLLFIMALSPLYFAGIIFPEIKKKVSDNIFGLLVSQSLFMPAYLFLMYIALRLISDDGFMKMLDTTNSANTSGVFGTITIGITIQYIIALIFINAPLLMAIEFGAIGMKWAPQVAGISKNLGGILGRNTIGRLSGKAGEAFDNVAAKAQGNKVGRVTSAALRNLGISQAVRGGLASAEKSKYGSSQSYGEVEKVDKARAKEIAGISRSNELQAAIAPGLGHVTPHLIPPKITDEQKKKFKDAVGKMGNKEFENQDFNTLIDPYFVRHLSSKQFDSIVEGDYLTAQKKDVFKKARMDNILLTLDSGDKDAIKDVMKGLSGKELSKISSSKHEKGGVTTSGSNVLTKNEIIDELTPSQLKDMGDIDGKIRAKIGARISSLPVGSENKASGFIRNNITEWS